MSTGNNGAGRITRRRWFSSVAGGLALAAPAPFLPNGVFPAHARAAQATDFPYPATGSADLTGDITVWVWDNGKEIVDPIVTEFRTLFPKINVNVEAFGNEDVHNKLTVAIQAGAGAPDVSWVDQMRVGKAIFLGGATDVRPAITPYLDQFAPFKIRTVTGANGEIFGWPNDIGPTGLWYNAPIFDQYGISVPENWDDYVAVGRALKDHGVALHSLPPSSFFGSLWLGDLVHQNGGSFFTAEGQPTITSPEVIEVLGWLRILIDEGLTAQQEFWTAEFFQAWKDGKLATFNTGAWQLSFWPDSLGVEPGADTGVRLAPSPTFKPDGAIAGNDGGAYMIVTKQSKNPDAANAYCRFVATSQMAGNRYRETGLIPSYLPNLENTEALEQHYPEYGGEQVWQTVVNLAKAMPPDFLYPAAYAEVWNAMTENWPAFYSGQAPDAWAAEVQQRAESIVANYQS